MATYYPTLDIETLRNLEVVRALAKEQPTYFDGSPYSPEVERLVKAAEPLAGPSGKDCDETSEAIDALAEVTSTFKQLTNHKPDKEDAAQLMGYFRTRTALLEKLIELEARGKNQKDISEFYTEVLRILEEVCSPTQIAQFSDRLKEFAAK
jgi:hypothetical protein